MAISCLMQEQSMTETLGIAVLVLNCRKIRGFIGIYNQSDEERVQHHQTSVIQSTACKTKSVKELFLRNLTGYLAVS
ncbi:MAG: hypothetical protein HW412_2562 [Bacteroidetes bacterium]|nr:hypothetical protein [Bacteroidota bacterium]